MIMAIGISSRFLVCACMTCVELSYCRVDNGVEYNESLIKVSHDVPIFLVTLIKFGGPTIMLRKNIPKPFSQAKIIPSPQSWRKFMMATFQTFFIVAATAAAFGLPIISILFLSSIEGIHAGRNEAGGFREVALDLHNIYRKRSDLPLLRLMSELNQVAHSHAENLATTHEFSTSTSAYGTQENLWAHRGPLRTISLDTRDAVNCWYTGSTYPGNTVSLVKLNTLFDPDFRFLGIGVGTHDNYTVVVANYL